MKPEDSPDELELAYSRLKAEDAHSNLAAVNLKASGPDTPRENLIRRIQQEKELRQKHDEACRYWIEHRGWPSMPQHEALILWERVCEVYMLAELLYRGGLRSDEKTEAEILEFLLISGWESVGVHRFRARLYQE